MSLTSKERSAIWRQQLRENPVLYEKIQTKREKETKGEKEWVIRKRKRNKRRINRKRIKDMTSRERRKKSEEWRTAWKNERKRDRDIISKLPETHPNSLPPQYQDVVESRVDTMRRPGKTKQNRNRAKVYRTIQKLQVSLFNQKKLVNKWKQKCHRLKKRWQSDMEQKAEKNIKRGEARNALISHQSILERMPLLIIT